MLFKPLIFLCGLLTVVSAHFKLEFPPPRGPHVSAQQVNFCSGYNNAVSNRSEFPLNDGFISLNSGHGSATVGVIVSTAQNPTSFDNFTTAVDFFSYEPSGILCFPVNLNATGIDGIQDGANVTLQVVYSGGDGNLYECADVTLSSNFTTPSNVSCTNTTTDDHHGSGGSDDSNDESATNAASTIKGLGFAAMLSIVGAVMSLL